MGNALSIPVLPLSLQAFNSFGKAFAQDLECRFGDALEPAWASMRESSISAVLSRELAKFGSTFATWLLTKSEEVVRNRR